MPFNTYLASITGILETLWKLDLIREENRVELACAAAGKMWLALYKEQYSATAIRRIDHMLISERPLL